VITLVTGATGFVGSHVVRQLVERGERVRVLARPESCMHALDGLAVEVVLGDLRSASAVRAAMRGVRRVFHAGADYRLWARNPLEIYETNVVGTKNIVSGLDAGVERLVYTSTVGTIAVPHARWPDEGTNASLGEMIGHYKRSKFMAEKVVLDAASHGVPAVIVNPTTPVGPGDWRPTPTGNVILDFLRRRMPAYVQTGLNVVPVEDVARGHLLAADLGRIGDRYLLGGRNMTLKEVLDALSAISGLPAPRLRLPWSAAMALGYVDWIAATARGREPRIPLEGVRMARHMMWANSTKAARELGFQAGSVEAALQRAVEWYCENGYVSGDRQRIRRSWRGADSELDQRFPTRIS
jgi:dihydroflavonol-4-reductase